MNVEFKMGILTRPPSRGLVFFVIRSSSCPMQRKRVYSYERVTRMQDDQNRTATQTKDDLNLSFDPIDWQQLELLASLTPAQRVLLGMQAQAFARAALRGTLRRRFPELSQSELNMKVLAHFTPLRGYKE